MRNIVVDSGPFIALFNGADKHHQAAVAFIRSVKAPLYSNIAVLTEVVYLLDFKVRAQLDFLRWIRQAVHIDDATSTDLPRIIEIIQKYADLPADFTDASLIALCERLKTHFVATIDSDFTIYRDIAKRSFTNPSCYFDRVTSIGVC